MKNTGFRTHQKRVENVDLKLEGNILVNGLKITPSR